MSPRRAIAPTMMTLLTLAACALCASPMSALAAGKDSMKKAAAGASAKTGVIDRTKPPVLGATPALKLPKIQTLKLANGLEIAVIEMHEVPVVDVTLLLRAGAVRDPADLPGLATFVANMLDEGAGTRDALAIAEETAFLGATLGAGSGSENTTVNLHCIKPRLGAALDLLADIVVRPVFADSEVVRQRELRQNALLQLRDQPTQMAPIAFNTIVYGATHPYGRPLGGNEASTAKLTRERVLEFYNTFYRPNNARMLIVGDVTLAEAKQFAESRFGAWKPGEIPALAALTAPAPGARTFYLVDKPGAAQSVIRIGHVGIARSNPDYIPVRVMNTILGGSFTSRLNNNLRETRGYTYGARSQFDMRREPGPFVATASVVTAKTDSSVIEFMKELRGMRDAEVPASEVEKAKAYIALGFPGDFEATADAAVQYLDLIANDLPFDEYATFMDRILKVTPADVQRVARTYIDPDHFAIVVVGDRKEIESGIRALNEGAVTFRDLWGQEIQP